VKAYLEEQNSRLIHVPVGIRLMHGESLKRLASTAPISTPPASDIAASARLSLRWPIRRADLALDQNRASLQESSSSCFFEVP
jgi:hypothetical protein